MIAHVTLTCLSKSLFCDQEKVFKSCVEELQTYQRDAFEEQARPTRTFGWPSTQVYVEKC